jgi:hypothetical protein
MCRMPTEYSPWYYTNSSFNLIVVTFTVILAKFKLNVLQSAADLINSRWIIMFCCNVNLQEAVNSPEYSAGVVGIEAEVFLLRLKRKCPNSCRCCSECLRVSNFQWGLFASLFSFWSWTPKLAGRSPFEYDWDVLMTNGAESFTVISQCGSIGHELTAEICDFTLTIS